MILYTAIPYEDIFSSQISVNPSYHNVQDGIVETIADGKNQIVRRLISTNPYAYLNNKYMPNSIFK